MSELIVQRLTFQELIKRIRIESDASNTPAFLQLQEYATDGPKFFIGQQVYYKLEASVSYYDLSIWYPFKIGGIRQYSDVGGFKYKYDLLDNANNAIACDRIAFEDIDEDELMFRDGVSDVEVEKG